MSQFSGLIDVTRKKLLYAVTLIPDSLYHPLLLHPFILCRWCGIYHGPPSTWSLPIYFNSLSENLVARLPSSTLELSCPNGNFFALDDKFTSLAFDRVISQVFDFSSFIHILWFVLLVPWEPLSLLVVSLALVNGPHHWPVIKRLSSMFDFNTSIHMFGFVLWLGCVGVQDRGLRLQKSRLQGDVTWSCWYTCLSQMDGCDHTMSCYMWSFSLLDGCDHTLVSIWSPLLDGCAHALDPFTWSLSIWLHPYHDSCIIFQCFSDVYVSMLSYSFSDKGLRLPTSTSSITLVHPSFFREHLLHNIFSLSLYSPFLDLGGPLQWTLHDFPSWRDSHYVPLHE